MVLDEGFDQAWRRLGLVIDRMGFELVDRDRTAGWYLVRYLDPAYEAKVKEPAASLPMSSVLTKRLKRPPIVCTWVMKAPRPASRFRMPRAAKTRLALRRTFSACWRSSFADSVSR